jgi:hypothetical protein
MAGDPDQAQQLLGDELVLEAPQQHAVAAGFTSEAENAPMAFMAPLLTICPVSIAARISSSEMPSSRAFSR